ncbi:MAG: 6,7-dimethyl-8-ribityllumazine synthase [Deltaproteobacteria bacterium]|nr:6,7-dimethyl-8-ribityllumazine synthase [Deltaproteobacteria bacterium]
MKFAIIVSKFNESLTQKLCDGAKEVFLKNNVSEDNIDVFRVPGSFEIPLMAQNLARTKKYVGLVAIGIIIKGETDHYQHVTEGAVSGILKVSLENNIPIGNCVLACHTWAQAEARCSLSSSGPAGGSRINRGCEAAEAVLEMVELNPPLP